MKIKKVIFTLVVIATSLSACKKNDNILPVGEPPFKGIYNPAVQVQQLNLATLRVDAEGDTVSTPNALIMRWFWNVNHLLGINCRQTVGDTTYYCSRNYVYDDDNRLAQVGTDFKLMYANGRISLIRIEKDEGVYSNLFRFYYNDSDYPDNVVFFVNPAKSTPEVEYRMRWRDGNIVTIIPDDRYVDSVTYTYDRLINPFCGFFWPEQWEENLLLLQIPFLSHNNPETITLYKDGQVFAHYPIRYEYIDTKPFRINFSLPGIDADGNPYTTHYTYTLHYVK